MKWEVEYSDVFEHWWSSLTEEEQQDIAASVGLVEEMGPRLPYPHSSGVQSSKHSIMRELRVQHKGRPYRVLYAFDPRRVAMLLIGGDKKGDDAWYDRYVPLADRIYDEHLIAIEKEGSKDG